jgi:two-component system, NtrC family, response regulator AtoC
MKQDSALIDLDLVIVEDDELQRKAMFDLLSGWGCSVRACDSISDAKRLLEEASPDLVFTDMRLPDGNGLEFLAACVKEKESARMVMMTAYGDVATAVHAIKSGAYDYLPKPFEQEQLRKIVRNVAEHAKLGSKCTGLSRLTLGGGSEVWQFDRMIGTEALKVVFEMAERVAGLSDSTVLIQGESGTGKGMLASAVHSYSRRADKPFVDINCSAIPEQLIESEIFGYEKGAFTDAKLRKPGLLELADGGTVFLDEIGDMQVSLQSKLLKVIEDRRFRRLGGTHVTEVDVRIVAATSRDLKSMVKQGKFREDLYYRLSVVPITMPPLREHLDSVIPLARYYLDVLSRGMGRKMRCFSPDAEKMLMAYKWPGNIRELRNVVERGIILAKGDEVAARDLGIVMGSDGGQESDEDPDIKPMSLADCEKKLIKTVIASVDGNKNRAAEILQIHRTTLYKKLEEYGL